ncbi:MAG: biotin attachment protein [Planctomycetes bacterium]|nr:biotin attachment protein [Planctomycetota bacterium]
MADSASVCDIAVPDLGLADVPMTLSVWLVPLGTQVIAGDRIVEILAGDVTVDLAAPMTGVLVDVLVREDDLVRPGQVLGLIECQPPDEE